MRRRTTGMGRIFKRRSRATGKEMSTWWVAYYVDGKERRESSHSAGYDAAKSLLQQRLHEISGGTYVGPERERVTVGDLLDGVVAYYDLRRHRSLPSVRGHVKVWKAELGETRRALDVTTQRLQRITQVWRQGGATPATINRRLGVLRRAYRLGKLRLDPARLDFTDLFLPENSPRGRYITPDAFAAIHSNLPDSLKDFFEFAYLTGVRKGQLARTTWAHWNDETKVLAWNPEDVKTKEPHVLPLDGRPLEIIASRYEQRVLHCRYVFHGPLCAPARQASKEYGCVGDFGRVWDTACKKASFPVGRKHGGYVFHNTRHTAVTNLVNAGVPAHEAMAVSGHRTRSVFDRYSIRVEEQTRAALRRTTAYTEQLRADRKVVSLTDRRAK